VKNLQKIRSVFCEALEKETQEQREAYLSQACRDDSALRAEVEALLRAQSKADDFFKNPLVGPETAQDTVSEGPGTVIGRYKLLEKIGEGGIAVVYMAEQAEPIRRKVALKIIKLGMDTRQVIARFEAERQALALMDHPSIAKVLDAGATETGRPYFVMELVTGVSITEYCDKNNLSTKDRLALFLQVCNAVQHAHQKGIIHRDIKPSNVMVTHHDGKPVPKVIDFGIAKATNQRLTEKTLFTRYAHIIGTPAYMSPEQAELSDLDIDTRTDIYSLGVLLYELLTGTTPFSEEDLRKAGYIEMQRVIREQEPAKPSTKLSTLGDTLTDIAKHRGCTPDLLRKAVRGDLDWIVMKSLEKDRARRYETPNGLASDILRHLEHEPVLARGPSATYRLQKLLRKHRSKAIVAVVMAGAIGGGIVVFSLWSRTQMQLAKAEGSRHRSALFQAQQSLIKEDIAAALVDVRPLVVSRHVGPEARMLHERILAKAREQVSYFTDKIGAASEDADNYFRRAQRYYYLNETDKALADMDRYTALVNPREGTDTYRRWLSALGDQQRRSGYVFGTPVSLGPSVNTIYGEYGASVSPDGLTLYFSDGGPFPVRSGGYGGGDLWVVTRRTLDDRWTEPVNLGATINSAFADGTPYIAADGLSLYFASARSGGSAQLDLYVSTRAARDLPWEKPMNLGEGVNSTFDEYFPNVSADGLTMHFGSLRSGGGDIYVATRPSSHESFGLAENVGSPANTAGAEETCPWVSSNGCTLFFTSRRAGSWDIWVSRRATAAKPWGEPVNLGLPVSTPSGGESGASFAADGRRFFFHGNHVNGFGNSDLWEARVLRTPDGFPEDAHTDEIQPLAEPASGKEVMPRSGE